MLSGEIYKLHNDNGNKKGLVKSKHIAIQTHANLRWALSWFEKPDPGTTTSTYP